MKNFNKEFLITLANKLCNLFANNTLSVNELFDKFVATFVNVVNEFVKVFATKKKLKQKPLITSNLLKWILTKNDMYNGLRINRNSVEMVESYKIYRNVQNPSLRIAYYQRVLRGVTRK